MENLRQENGQIQEWINTVEEFVIAIDSCGTIVRVNQAWIEFCLKKDVHESLYTIGADYFAQLKAREKIVKSRLSGASSAKSSLNTSKCTLFF
ncbi:hypothetical protein [Planomicrobium sp. YIM 101495]|uniref:hypothetical protein n=1 Tax=Planomicrobium sp. YIM 101495 TaxID=2665160 RepID=UPI0018AB9395|nr:hypothetical protein [Planomicrobium sp. YIM 101495]